jgi:hypothetical protein
MAESEGELVVGSANNGAHFDFAGVEIVVHVFHTAAERSS